MVASSISNMQPSPPVSSMPADEAFTTKATNNQRVVSEGEGSGEPVKHNDNEGKGEMQINRDEHAVDEQHDKASYGEQTSGYEEHHGAAEKAKFQVKDWVFARDGKGIYEAVVQKVAMRHMAASSTENARDPPFEWVYFVHFKGWSKRHDKWVSESLVLDPTPEARLLAHTFQQEEMQRKEEQLRQKREHLMLKKEKKSKRKKRSGSLEDDASSIASDNSPVATEGIDSTVKRNKRRRTASASDDFSISASRSVPTEEKEEWNLLNNLPFALKTILVDDREKIVPQPQPHNIQPSAQEWYCCRMLPNLPASVTIKQCLEQYVAKKITQQQKKAAKKGTLDAHKDGVCVNSQAPPVSAAPDSVPQRAMADEKGEIRNEEIKKVRSIVKGLATLFDNALPVYLLYNQERIQYYMMRQRHETPSQPIRNCELYGCEHLLRLFARLPLIVGVLSSSTINTSDERKKELKEMLSLVSDLIRFLQKNRNRFFKGTYRLPQDYELTQIERKLQDRARKARSEAAGMTSTATTKS